MTPGEKLRRVRKLLPGDVDQLELDDKLGMKAGRTSTYERDRAKPSTEYLLALQKKYGIPPTYIFDPADNWPPHMQGSHSGGFAEKSANVLEDAKDDETDEHGELLLIQLFGDVPAGEWDESDADPELIEVEKDIYHKSRFARRIRGESMSPALHSGDLAFFHPTSTPTDGVIVLAENEDGLKTVKTCRYKDGEWILEPLNRNSTMSRLKEWKLTAYLTTVKRTYGKGLQVRFHNDAGIQPEMLPKD